jgi:nucleoid DNA-binding protein
MTKKELIDKLADENTISKKETAALVDNFISTIDRLPIGEKLSLKGFGTFAWIKKPATTARNPKTGESVDVPEKNVLRFKASKP